MSTQNEKFENTNTQSIQRDEEMGILFLSIDQFLEIEKTHSTEWIHSFKTQLVEHLERYESVQLKLGPHQDDYFIIFMSGSAQQLTMTANLIRRGISSMDSFQNISVSVGVAHSSQVERSFEKLVLAAEEAALKAEKWGGNRVVSTMKSSIESAA